MEKFVLSPSKNYSVIQKPSDCSFGLPKNVSPRYKAQMIQTENAVSIFTKVVRHDLKYIQNKKT